MRRGQVYNRGTKRAPNWTYIVDVQGPGEPRKQQRRSGFRTRTEAQSALNDVITALQRDEFVPPSKLTVEEFLTEWLAAIRSTVRPSTLSSYDMIVRQHIAPAIGKTLMQRLTADRLNAFYADLIESGRRDGAGLSPKTVRNIHVVVRKALGDALRWGRVSRNVAELADPPELRASRRTEMKFWTAEQLRTFLEGVAADDDLSVCWITEANTGLRRGELLGLRWLDSDLDAGRLSIRQTIISVDYRIEFSDPKTDRGKRVVALDAGTVAVLRAHRKEQTRRGSRSAAPTKITTSCSAVRTDRRSTRSY
jgi:integrase